MRSGQKISDQAKGRVDRPLPAVLSGIPEDAPDNQFWV